MMMGRMKKYEGMLALICLMQERRLSLSVNMDSL